MYATNNNPWGSPKASEPAFSVNNPFVEGTAADRFPEIEPSTSQQQSLQQVLPNPSQFLPSAPPPPPQLQQRQIVYGASSQQSVGWDSLSGPQQQSAYSSSAISGHVMSQQQQPSGYAGFGQQYDQPNSYVGQQNWLPQYQQAATYTQQYQQGVINEFDPYGRSAGSGQHVSSNMPRLGPSGQQHPRQYIQTHKVQLESWNEAIWKQAFFTFEELKRAWEGRRAEIQRQQLTGRYLSAEEVAHLNNLTRDAESNIDSVVASLVQIQEVYHGYKQSLDVTSRGRVKEALNAGLRGLPEWP